jgi:hypothetical protein
MDKVMAGLILLGLIAFGALCAVESCCKPEETAYESKQQAAEARGEGEHYYDADGKLRFAYYDELAK